MIATRVIAHRGASSLAPENTLPALAAAADAGARWVEIDAQVTADDIAVVFHDERLERCTNGRGVVTASRWVEIKGLDAGSWFAPRFRDARIPRLEDALDLCRDRDLGVNLELKLNTPSRMEALVAGVLAAVQRRPLRAAQLLLSAFEPRSLALCQTGAPALPRGLIVRRIPSDIDVQARALDLATLHPDHRRLRSTSLKAARDAGLEIYAWTVNAPKTATRLWQSGVEGVITDRPQALIQEAAR